MPNDCAKMLFLLCLNFLSAIQMKITKIYRHHTLYIKYVYDKQGNQISIVFQNDIKTLARVGSNLEPITTPSFYL